MPKTEKSNTNCSSKLVSLTDQELNEWVANNIFDNNLLIISKYWGEESSDFCGNLNATHLMEEKIREMGQQNENKEWYWSDEYSQKLLNLLRLENSCYEDVLFKVAHASARQRAEAAYLTFKDKKRYDN